jgi:hypothetical protein
MGKSVKTGIQAIVGTPATAIGSTAAAGKTATGKQQRIQRLALTLTATQKFKNNSRGKRKTAIIAHFFLTDFIQFDCYGNIENRKIANWILFDKKARTKASKIRLNIQLPVYPHFLAL